MANPAAKMKKTSKKALGFIKEFLIKVLDLGCFTPYFLSQ